MFFFEIAIAFFGVRYWVIQTNAVSDQKRLIYLNEILDRAREDSIALGRISFQATVAPESKNISAYRDKLHQKAANDTDESPVSSRMANPLLVVERGVTSIKSPIAFIGKAELQRLEKTSLEFESLLRIEEKTLAALEGRFEDENGQFTVIKSPDPELARSILRDQSYQTRRNELAEDLLAIQAAFDLRVLTLLTEIQRNTNIYFPLGMTCLAVLLLATPVVGFILNNHLSKSASVYKKQIRKMNEEFSRVLGQLSKLESERNELARQVPKDSTIQTPLTPQASPIRSSTRPSQDYDEAPPQASTFPGGYAEDYLTRLP